MSSLRAAAVTLLVSLVSLCAVASAAPTGTGSPASGAHRTLHFALVADLDGRFARFGCDATDAKRPGLARLVGAIRARRAALLRQGHTLRTLVTGDFLGASTAARYLLSREERGAPGLASALTRTDALVHGVGNGELALPKHELRAYATALRAAGVPFGSVNLSCDASRAVVCGQRGAETLATVDGVRVGAFALQYDDFEGKVDPTRLAGLRFEDPASRTVAALARLKKRGAQLRVGVVHRGRGGSPEEELTQMAEALRGWIDLVVTDAISEEASAPRVVRVGLGQRAVTVVQVPGGVDVWYELAVRVDAKGRVLRTQVTPHRVTLQSPADPPLASWIAGARTRFCARWAHTGAAVPLSQPYEAADFVWLVLHIMRQAGGGDVSVVNQGAFDLSSGFPLTRRLRSIDLFRVLRFRNKLVRITVTGEELESLVAADPGDDAGKKDLHWVGVDVRDDEVFVNGRALDKRLSYRLVTIDFLARGGDDTFEPMPKAKLIDGGRTLRDHVTAWLRRFRGKLGAPASAFVDYWDKPLWRLTFNGKVDFSSIAFTNAAGYVDPQLTNLDFRQIDAAVDTSLTMNTRDHGWLNRLVLTYSQTSGVDRTAGVVQRYSLVNTDVVRGETTYQFRYLRDTVFDRSWWAPLLTVYGRARTELDVPAGQRYRWADVDGLLGVAWELGANFQIRAGGGLNRELLRTLPGPYFRPMVQFGYLLQQYPVLRLGSTTLLAQLEGDVRIKGVGRDQRETYYADTTLLARVFGPLMVYAQVELFAMRAQGPLTDFGAPDKAGQWTRQLRVNAGLALTAVGSRQMR